MKPGDGSAGDSLSELLRLLRAPGSLTSKVLGVGMRGFYGAWRHAGLEPGGEFVAAMQEAALLRPEARVVYGDQESVVTLQKLAATITLSAVLRAVASSLTSSTPLPPELASVLGGGVSAEEAVERLKIRETVRSLVRFTRSMHPTATRVLLDERDELLAAALRACPGPRVVGVVGLAHVDGIEARWAAMNGEKALEPAN